MAIFIRKKSVFKICVMGGKYFAQCNNIHCNFIEVTNKHWITFSWTFGIYFGHSGLQIW